MNFLLQTWLDVDFRKAPIENKSEYLYAFWSIYIINACLSRVRCANRTDLVL